MSYTTPRHGCYLGPLGRLVAVRGPDEGYSPSPNLGVTAHKLLSGKVRTERPAFTPRTYSLSWPYLSDAEKAWLEQCSLGLIPGALYWVDPLVRNQLPPSVSAPTGDVSNFQSTTDGTVAYLPAGSQGFGGVTWTPTVANAALRVLPRVPYVPGVPFTASAWVTRDSGASTTATMPIDWYDIAGTQLASTQGSPVTLATVGVAYQISVTATNPPAGAVEGRPAVVLADARTMRVDGWQVEYGSLSVFAPGPGLAKVAILGYEPDVYLSGITSVGMSMVEVAGFGVAGFGGGGFGGGGGSGGGDAVILYDAKGDILVGLSDDVPVRLPVGTNGQVLTVDTLSTLGVKWATGSAGGGVPLTLIDAKGDLILGSAADAAARLALGTNDQVLTVDTTTSTGVKWATGSGGGTVSSPIDLAEIVTPATPAVGRSKFYPKSDGRYYTLDDDGIEQLVGYTSRTFSTVSTATLVPEIRDYEQFEITGQAQALTIANHVDSAPVNFVRFQIRIFSAAVQTLTYGTNYVSGGPALPTATKAGKLMHQGWQWNSAIAKFELIAVVEKL